MFLIPNATSCPIAAFHQEHPPLRNANKGWSSISIIQFKSYVAIGGHELTSINLLDPRQRQPHFIPIHRRLSQLQRIPLEINRLKPFNATQLSLDLLKAAKEITGRPQFL